MATIQGGDPTAAGVPPLRRPRLTEISPIDDDARGREIYQALKAVDEVAAALQTHLVAEHHADPARSSLPTTPPTL
jgi:hypothetical protein